MARTLPQVLSGFAGQTVLVVGDVMVDHYLFGTVRRISPEAPVPVVDVASESTRPGGAANVLHNILTLGGRGLLCGVIGADDAGRWLTRTLQSAGGGCDGVIVDSGRPTTRKSRVVAHQQQVVRFDHEKREPLSAAVERQLAAAVSAAAEKADVIVVSDYAKGAITPNVMNAVRSGAARLRAPIIVDPKVSRLARYKGATLITPNHLEAAVASGIDIVDAETLERAGACLLRKAACHGILITRGERGMSLFETGRRTVHIPTEAKEVYDVTGAGDTVVATLALAAAAGAGWADAARLANRAAGLAVGMVGTAAITQTMLREALR